MLVMNVLNHQKTADVVYDRIFVLRVVEHSVLILAIVTDGVLQF
jgi:hypothetical protein